MFEQQGHLTSPADLKAQRVAERRGTAFLVYRDAEGKQQIVELSGSPDRVSVGRSPGADLALEWDADASRAHAELQRLGDVWTVVDDGLSRNGTFVNGERISGRRRLADGDQMRFGNTPIVFHDSGHAERVATAAAREFTPARISEAQRRVLVALARPFVSSNPFPSPASNSQIAQELSLSVHAVKTHLRALFHKFAVEHLPQNQKRARLVAVALQSGQVTERDLTRSPD